MREFAGLGIVALVVIATLIAIWWFRRAKKRRHRGNRIP